MQLLEFTGLSRRYGAQWALSGANGTLNAGEIVALQGENGSGKSTLLLTLAGILKPHLGRAQLAAGVRCHLVAHHPMAYTALSVLRNLELAAALQTGAATDITAAMTYWQIGHLAAKPFASLSRGQMQRFLLARAMLAAEKVLLLDEPFTGLDSNGEKLLGDFIDSEARRGVGIFFSDHDARRARSLAQRFIRMSEGRCLP
ncbi:MAG: ABC transporter ATP-binding protein [Spirochaetes bacterium]|nr:ABC transporter ATP-binding protein [Spirochaetota bacterium]